MEHLTEFLKWLFTDAPPWSVLWMWLLVMAFRPIKAVSETKTGGNK